MLNGSPRRNGNTAAFANAFKESAEEKGNIVEIENLASMTYGPCRACNYCQNAGKGKCIQKDDAAEVIDNLSNWDMIVFASPVYYWGLSGQMQAFISRFYPYGPIPVKKFALILSSASEDVYKGIVSQYHDIVAYSNGESLGEFCFNGNDQKTPANLNKIKEFAISLE